ncbi:MAG TPA: hypothetical protein GX714_14600 [Chloroflexi bacterium]|jgi:hypothetical protein|nr:hypothetical protein [Chloroflexota bacterium]
MAERKQVFRYALVEGAPVSAGETRVTPQARVLEVHWPSGGLVWNRPVAVIVERNGQMVRRPIVDATRLVQAMLGALAMVFSMAAAARVAGSMRRRHE